MSKIINILKEKKSIPLDQFINIALYDKKIGYYMKNNPFGKEGDFITSPLISNLFGEMLAIWCVAFWEHIGRPNKILLVELGPGDGSLCEDLLKTFCEHIGMQIGVFLKDKSALFTGGGTFNSYLMNRISHYSKSKIIIPNHKIINFKEKLQTFRIFASNHQKSSK